MLFSELTNAALNFLTGGGGPRQEVKPSPVQETPSTDDEAAWRGLALHHIRRDMLKLAKEAIKMGIALPTFIESAEDTYRFEQDQAAAKTGHPSQTD